MTTQTITASARPRRTTHRRRREISPLIPALVALLGILCLLYPVFATQHNDVMHQKNANKYSVDIESASEDSLAASLELADQYNADLAGGLILDPFLKEIVPDTPEYQAYLGQLNVLDAMSQLRVPAADINLPIYHGTEEKTLKHGVGHLFGTSLPVGGESTHAVVTGHTGLGDATLFNGLTDVKKGDAIYLNTEGRKLKYVVTDIEVVLPTDVSKLERVPGKDLITLITCTPYGINSHRLLVTGERAPLDAVDEQVIDQDPPIKAQWKWWMVALLVAAALSVLVVGGLVLRLVLARRNSGKPHRRAARRADAHMFTSESGELVDGRRWFTDESDGPATRRGRK